MQLHEILKKEIVVLDNDKSKWSPIISSIKIKRTISSKSFNNFLNFAIVQITKVSFSVNPQTKAEYAICGSDSAIFDNNFSCVINSSTSNLIWYMIFYKSLFQLLLRDVIVLLL